MREAVPLLRKAFYIRAQDLSSKTQKHLFVANRQKKTTMLSCKHRRIFFVIIYHLIFLLC